MSKWVWVVPLAVVALFALVAMTPFTVVQAGERGVVLQWGAFTGRVLAPGIHWRTPLVEKVIHMDVQTQKIEHPTIAYSKDIQSVDTRLALNYHVDPEKVGTLYSEIGLSFEERIIMPSIEEAVKQSTANFTAEELISRRGEVKEMVESALRERLQRRYIVLDEFSITDFSFSEQFEDAVEAKQVAEQQALKAKNDLDRVTIEAKQQVETAKAQAESIRIQAQALAQNKDLVNLRAVEKWDGKLPQYMLGEGSLPFLTLR